MTGGKAIIKKIGTGPGVKISFMGVGPMQLIVKAPTGYGNYDEVGTLSVNVPVESGELKRFTSYLLPGNPWPYNKWTCATPSTLEPMKFYTQPENNNIYFYAYETMPAQSPNAGYLKVLSYHYYIRGGGSYAFDYSNEYVSPTQTICYVFNYKHPDTIPLYKYEEMEYVNGSCEKWIFYLSPEYKSNYKKVTSWYWNWLGTKKTGERNWTRLQCYGVYGYVYSDAVLPQ